MILLSKPHLSKLKMTQSGPSKKPAPAPKEEPKTELQLRIEQLKKEKPDVYEQYVKAIRQKRPVSVYPDLSVRIG